MRHLAIAIDATVRGSGSLTIVEGPAGIGKSELLRALRHLARDRGVAMRSARCTEIERMDPFRVALRLVPEEAQPPEALPGYETVPESRARGALASALERTIGAGSWLLVIDDLQWCDRESLAVLREAVEGLIDGGCAVVLARRPEGAAEPELVAELARDPDAAILRLKPLSRESVAALLTVGLGVAPHPAFAEACLESCGGNPFLLHELVLELDERGLTATAAAASAVPLVGPQGVAAAIAHRVERAGELARRVTDAVAVLGDEAEPDVIAALVGASPLELRDAAHELAEAGVFSRGGGFAFTHAIVRSALLDGVRPAVVADRHAAAARVLADADAPPEQVARHLLPAPGEGAGWVVDTLRAAAARALARGAPEAAVRLLKRALDEPPAASERPSVELDLGGALAACGRAEAAAERLEIALNTLADPDLRADAALRLVRARRALGDFAAGVATLRRALDTPPPDPRRRFALRAEYAQDLSFGASAAADDAALEEIAALEREPVAGVEAQLALLRALASANLARRAIRRAEALSYARLALADNELAAEQDTPMLAVALNTLMHDDRFQEVLHRLEAAAATVLAAGSIARLTAGTIEVLALTGCGRLTDAVERGRAMMPLAAEQPSGPVAQALAGSVALALLARGRLADANNLLREWIEPHVEAALATPQALPLAVVLGARCQARLAAGEHCAALSDAELLGGVMIAARADNPAHWPWRSDAVTALVALARSGGGDRPRAIALAEEELAIARRWGAARPIARALRSLAAARGNGAGLDALHEAERTIAGSEAQLERAQVEIALGSALVEVGRPVDARTPLERGLAAAERFDAAPLAARAREALRAAGVRPATVRAGMDALTEGQRRVCRLAAEGVSNLEIAQQLFVSESTVRTHLRRAFRALGVSSRAQLADVLRSTPD